MGVWIIIYALHPNSPLPSPASLSIRSAPFARISHAHSPVPTRRRLPLASNTVTTALGWIFCTDPSAITPWTPTSTTVGTEVRRVYGDSHAHTVSHAHRTLGVRWRRLPPTRTPRSRTQPEPLKQLRTTWSRRATDPATLLSWPESRWIRNGTTTLILTGRTATIATTATTTTITHFQRSSAVVGWGIERGVEGGVGWGVEGGVGRGIEGAVGRGVGRRVGRGLPVARFRISDSTNDANRRATALRWATWNPR